MRFKKIVRPKEVDRILQNLSRSKQQVFCKGPRETFFGFKTLEYRQEVGLLGRIVIFHAKPHRYERVLVNFVLGTHRFFGLAKFGSDENRGLLKFDPVLYRLERRKHLRVPLAAAIKKVCNVIQWTGKTVFITGDIMDFSLGGAQISIPAEKYLPARQGSKLKIVLHVKTKWNIEIAAEIRRIEIGTKKVVLGLKFGAHDYRTQRQIQALAMELQREHIRQDYLEV